MSTLPLFCFGYMRGSYRGINGFRDVARCARSARNDVLYFTVPCSAQLNKIRHAVRSKAKSQYMLRTAHLYIAT